MGTPRGKASRERHRSLDPREGKGDTAATALEESARASSRVETGMSGNFLSCSKGVKDPLEVPEVRCD